MKKVIVTRHSGLIEYLLKMDLMSPEDTVVAHATVEDVKDRDVIGVLPLSLAVHANSITEVPLNIPAELRGKELSFEQVQRFAGNPVTYRVKEIPTSTCQCGSGFYNDICPYNSEFCG